MKNKQLPVILETFGAKETARLQFEALLNIIKKSDCPEEIMHSVLIHEHVFRIAMKHIQTDPIEVVV